MDVILLTDVLIADKLWITTYTKVISAEAIPDGWVVNARP